MERGAVIRIVLGLLLVLTLWLGGLYRASYVTHPLTYGETMGTGYSIRIAGKVKKDRLEQLKVRIDAALAEINSQMSTWDPESEISRFNHSASVDPVEVSPEFAAVVKRALDFSRMTGGAFDPTLQPLLNLWGFGSEATTEGVPSDEAVRKAMEITGWDLVEVLSPASLRKNSPGVSLALGAIAKGYGVDALAAILKDEGYENWLVEIGGEMALQGYNPQKVPWKVGIQFPSTDLDSRNQGVLHLTAGAVATSGDYRNYIEKDGVIYSHILDPRTGVAVLSSTASVSVYAPACIDADAIATALFVMGAEEGIAWVEQLEGVEAMFLLRNGDGAIIERFSSGFIAATGYTSAVVDE